MERMLELDSIYCGDCLEIMKKIDDKSIDMILCDLPYGITAYKWDTTISFELLWKQYERIIKDNGAIILTSSQPFTTYLIMSNIDLYKYGWIWLKSKGCNFVHAKNMPIKFHEDICVFSKASIGHKSQLGIRRMKYNPQGLVKVDRVWKRPRKYESGHKIKRNSHKLERVIEFGNYPTSILRFSNSDNRQRGLHPTQKPIALFEYLIKTYTDQGDLVLDNCAGSGTTGVACLKINRNFILIEKEEEYCKVICKRLGINGYKSKNEIEFAIRLERATKIAKMKKTSILLGRVSNDDNFYFK